MGEMNEYSKSQCAFTWRRADDGIGIVSGYDPEPDPTVHWLCWCGNFETGRGICSVCGNEPPWGDDEYDEFDGDLDFGEYEPDYYDEFGRI